jgi:hypothetical protein
MSVRTRITAVLGFTAAALAVVAAPVGATVQPPQGLTVSDGLICQGSSPAWNVTMVNQGPTPVVDFTVQVDGGAKADYDVGIGLPGLHKIFPAKVGTTHLVVLANGGTMVDATQATDCGPVPTSTTTTTVPKVVPHPTPTTVHTTVTTVQAQAAPAPADPPTSTVPPAVHSAATPPPSTLPFTGSTTLPLALTGTALVGAGAGAVLGTRARRTRKL